VFVLLLRPSTARCSPQWVESQGDHIFELIMTPQILMPLFRRQFLLLKIVQRRTFFAELQIDILRSFFYVFLPRLFCICSSAKNVRRYTIFINKN